MAFGRFNVGIIPAIVGRVTYTGDLGYELWVKPEHQRALFDLLMKEGADFGLKLFGGRALNSLRLEKSFGSWSREYRPIYTPWEAGLERFVSTQKPVFTGRDAMLKARDAGPNRKLATFVVDALDADVIGDEPIWRDGKVVGWVTSGGYAHHSKASVALGYVEAAAFDASAPYEIEIIGERRAAKVAAEPLFDPKGLRMRA
jgi:dimethylglycine dehydrogenase